jgi:hypothetical protein
MKIGRMLSLLMIVALALGAGIQAGPMAGCTDAPSVMGMADTPAAGAERHCGDMGQAPSGAGMACHGLCMASLIPPGIARAHGTLTATFVVPHESAVWRDRAVSPDPHPPRAVSHI